MLASPEGKDGVIAVRASDGYGKLMKFNLAKQRREAVAFSTLGHGIRHTRYENAEAFETFTSGTSFATLIAAGIAANILDYAQLEMKWLTKEKLARLFSTGCMKMILEAISNPIHGFHFIEPNMVYGNPMR